MVGFTQKVSELEPLFTSKFRFVVFGSTQQIKSLVKLGSFSWSLILEAQLRFSSLVAFRAYLG